MKEIKHDQRMIREHHLLLLFKMIKRNGPISRAALAKKTQMSATSASKIVKELIDQNFVEEIGQTEGSVGRKATLLRVNPSGALTIGINIDLESIEVGIVDLSGNVVMKKSRDIDLSVPPTEVLDCVIELVLIVKEQIGDLADRIIGCGVSIPGIVEWPQGRVVMIPQFHWANVEIRTYLEAGIGMTVFVDNQVKAILLGESLYGSVIGMDNAACIFVGSGVGGAFMDKGEVIRGSKNIAGEIGHTTVDPDGSLCDCGRFGCLQTFICASALEKESGKRIQDIFAAEQRQETWAVKMLDRASEYLAMAISNVACTYNPEAVVLVGPMIDQYPHWAETVEKKCNRYLWNNFHQDIEIKYPHIGSHAGIIGASCLVLREFLESPIRK
ncbi:ROK family transcriptional regulator [Paenibacillus sp. 598K]|uniref:ROK family transcriptional regulator n=1 Tax=Paenibacillus sp. 598K TaxID=1117987 RepID=UPI000FF92E5D|nr:ROK family transcriptional regulator [Paenibacillus sp. 598K]GBF74353.1 ROK family transcriptional regulator [Paenibacillus sp. 598K]